MLPATDGPARCAAALLRQDIWQDLDASDVCRVTAFGRAHGASPPLHYQLQAYRPAGAADDDGAGAVLLAQAGVGMLQSISGWSGGNAAIDPPTILSRRQGPIVVLPMTAVVSSRPTYDIVLRAAHGRWVQVSDDWFRRVHVPKGSIQSHGNAMEWPTLRAYGAF